MNTGVGCCAFPQGMAWETDGNTEPWALPHRLSQPPHFVMSPQTICVHVEA